MAMISNLIATLMAAIAGFIGHIAAHDFVDFVPTLTRRLIRTAVRRLPTSERDRYAEEWLSDLNERIGVFSKLNHAFGCVLCSRQMRSQSMKYSYQVENIRVDFASAGAVQCNFSTLTFVTTVAGMAVQARKKKWMKNKFVATAISMALVRIHFFRYGPPDLRKAQSLMDVIKKPKDMANWSVWLNGRRIKLPTL
jgi:hypothetical protein